MKLTLTIIFGLFLFGLITVNAQQEEHGSIRVIITEASSDKGQMAIGLYDSQENWLNKIFKGIGSEIEDGGCEVLFEKVPYGEYAVSIFHDKNGNGKFDMFLGFLPKEDYGCSNQAKGSFGPPTWIDAKFTLSQKEKEITIKL